MPGVLCPPRWRDWGSVATWLAGLWFVLFVCYFFSGLAQEQLTAVTDFAYLPLNVVAVATGLRVVRSSRVDPGTRKAWRFITLAVMCQFGANTAWFWVETVRHTNPYPSVADIGYLAFIPVLLVGLLVLPTRRRTARERATFSLDVITVVAGGFMILWYLVLGPVIALGGPSAIATMASICYPVGDLVLMFGIAAVLLRGTMEANRRSLQILIVALTAFVVADVYYAYVGVHEGFAGGTWPDLFWLSANFLFAASANAQYHRSTRAVAGLAEGTGFRPVSRLPYAAVAGGYGLLLVIARSEHLYPLGGMIIGAVVLTGAVVLRQFSVLHENRQLAVTDSLTGIANRALMQATLARALTRSRHPGSVAVLLIDLNSFKDINDSLGHEAGDAVLVAVAEYLRSCSRAGDTPGRLGGDEFAVILEDLGGPSDAVAVAERFLRALNIPISARDRKLVVGASIGIALSEAGIAPSELLHHADVAMYAAKKAGKGRYEVYQPGMGVGLLDSELRHALEQDQFVLHYQPILRLDTGEVAGVEALIRWQHPTRGLVPPGAFIPLAEDSGFIVELGGWVLSEACRQLVDWSRRIPATRAMALNVNLAPRQARHPGLAGDVAATLRATGLEPDRLILELTEGALMPHDTATVEQLQTLHRLGVRIAVDDFGTGYASLSYLNAFPVDVLKIDRTFTSRLTADDRSRLLSEAVVRLGRTLGLQTVAEGIETAEELAVLRRIGCPLGQGFHLARPLEAAGLEPLLTRSVPWAEGLPTAS